MDKTLNTLIIEDEPLMVEPMEKALKQMEESNGFLEFRVRIVTSCDAASYEIKRAIHSEPIDLVLLDINLLPSTDGKYVSGEDLGVEIRKYFPKAKLLALTSHHNNYRLNNILKNLNPEGFLIKREVDFDKLIDAIKSVIDDCPYYSKLILQLMRRHITNDFTLDRIDRQLLYQISKGSKMKHLTEIITLSKSAIELRKRNLKEVFGVEEGDDRNLILRAEECGFI